MPTLAAFDDAVTRRVTREVAEPSFEAVRERVENGLTWGVGGLVEDGDDRVLLVYEDGTWKLPGGGVEDGESRQAALAREVREETGVSVRPGDLLAVTEVTVTDGGRETRFHFGTYRADPLHTDVAADPGLADEDIERVEWREDVPENCLDADLVDRVR